MRDPPKIQEIARVRNGCKVFRVRLRRGREREVSPLDGGRLPKFKPGFCF